MSRRAELLAALTVLGAVGTVAYLNAGQRVTLHLGLFVIERLPLAALLLGAVLFGMLVMFLTGLRNDLRVRRLLRERLERDI